MAEASAKSLLTAHSSLSRSARSATSAVMAAASARVAPSRRSAGSWPLCRSANLAALSACASFSPSSIRPLKSRAKASLTRASRTRVKATEQDLAHDELADLCEAKRSYGSGRAQSSVGLTLPSRVRGSIAGRLRRRARQGLACERELFRSLHGGGGELHLSRLERGRLERQNVRGVALLLGHAKRCGDVKGQTQGRGLGGNDRELLQQVRRQRVDCVSGQQPHLLVSAVSDQEAHNGAVPALRCSTESRSAA